MKNNKSKNRSSLRWILKVVASDRFFWGVVVLLVIQAGWIAISGSYPMAFDEDFHLGLIKIYSHHPNPFWTGQVAGGDAYGAVARDPSYLYHYLMSFPYRFISLFTTSLHLQVLLLRFMNIGFFAIGLVAYRRLLLKTKVSKSLVHITLLILVLIPVTSLLAAQINYDNLFIPLTGLSLLLTLQLYNSTNKKRINVRTLLLLLLVCLFTAIVKYAFLPIFVAIVGYITVTTWRQFSSFVEFISALKRGLTKVSLVTLVALIMANLMVGMLFVERYGVNLVRYHKPIADCAEVLNYDHCQYYGPWIRDYNFKQQKINSNRSPVAYSYEWLYGMWLRSFFSVDGPRANFETRGPLTAPAISALLFGVSGLVAFIWCSKSIWRRYNRPALWLISATTLIYTALLWLEEYRLYLETGRPVAINGRYLLPVLPFLILFAALGIKTVFENRPRLQLAIAGTAVVCLLWGGGALTYILRSNDQWLWPNNQMVISVNRTVRNAVGPVTPGYYAPTQFMR